MTLLYVLAGIIAWFLCGAFTIRLGNFYDSYFNSSGFRVRREDHGTITGLFVAGPLGLLIIVIALFFTFVARTLLKVSGFK